MNRRDLLRGAAAGLITAPFLGLLDGSARASGGTAQRLILFFSPNGTVHSQWRPTTGPSGLSFPAGSILEPLADHASDLLVMESNFNTGNNHEGGMSNMLTAGGNISIDQVVADGIGGASRFQSLELGALTSAWGSSNQTRMCYRDGQLISPDDDPANVWNRMFGDLGDPLRAQRRQSVLDRIRGDVATLQSRMGAAERARLDIHLESLREVERSLEGSGTCTEPGAQPVAQAGSNDAFPDIVQSQIDLAVQALACDMTRVVSLQLSHTVGPVVFTWLGESEGHHALSHIDDSNTAGIASFVNCERWFASQFAYLLQRLKDIPDPVTGAPMLEDTVVLWVQELGDGRLHQTVDVPWVLAGAPHCFTPNRHVTVDTTHDGILTSVANAFGLGLSNFGMGTGGPAGVLS